MNYRQEQDEGGEVALCEILDNEKTATYDACPD
jgi:hypothetical protein